MRPVDGSLVLLMSSESRRNGTRTIDLSRFKNDGTVYGAIWRRVSPHCSGLSFDGVDDYVEVADDESLHITDEITITAWVKPSLPASGYIGVMTQVCGGEPYYNRILIANNGQLLTQFEIGGSSDNFFSTNVVNDGQWSHIAYVYDGSNEMYYINGNYDSSDPASGNIDTGNNDLWIGRGYKDGYFFDGLIGEVRLYNRALSGAEISALYSTRKHLYGG